MLNFPMEAVDVAMSSTNAGFFRAGAENAIGFVPSMGSRPKVGTIGPVGVPVLTIPTRPSRDAMRA